MSTIQTVQKLLPIARALVLRAGARHSQADNTDIQAMHDLACKLGAKCRTISDGTHTQFSAEAMKAELYDELVLRHGHHNQKLHGQRHGVGGLREFAGQRGHQIREIKDKDGKSQFAITDKNDKRTKMRAGGITEAKKLITSANKFKKESAKRQKEREDFGFSVGDVVKPKDKSGIGINNAFKSKIVGSKGSNFIVRPIGAKPGSFADREFLIPKREVMKV